MAGFYVVGMALVAVIILMAIILAFEIMSILSIVFSAVSLSKSKKYILLGGRYDFRSVKRFHNAAVVFFVFGCIGVFFVISAIISLLFELVGDSYNDTYEFFETLPFNIFVLGKYTALFAVGIKSFLKFSDAKALQESLHNYNNSAYSYGQPPTNAYPHVYVQTPGYSADAYSNGRELNVTAEQNIVKDSADANREGIGKKDVSDKVCPKCGAINNGMYNFCTFCGERLNLQ